MEQHGIDAKVVATAGAEETLRQLSKEHGSVVAFAPAATVYGVLLLSLSPAG